MRKLLCIVSVFALSIFLQSASVSAGELNSLTEKEKADGWVLLFDGKSMDHFRNFKGKGIKKGWAVKDGAMVHTKGGGDIITKEQFDAFELSIEYSISKGGNSGIMYHVTEEEKTPWRTGPEIQIQDNIDGHDPQKAGWLYQLYPAKDDPKPKDATKPVGEWNHIRILITPEKCEHYMNGTKYCEYVKGSEEWNAKVKQSKFGRMPKFGLANKGHIALQDHGNVVKYRNIKIRPIKK